MRRGGWLDVAAEVVLTLAWVGLVGLIIYDLVQAGVFR